MYLNAHTFFSLRYGTLSVSDLVSAAAQRGVKALALTDINNTSCSYTFVKCCREVGIKPVLGVEFRKEGRLLFIGLAKNREGFLELNQLLTNCSLDGEAIPDVAPLWKNCYVVYPIGGAQPLDRFRDFEFIGVRPEEVNHLHKKNWRNQLHRMVILSPIVFLDGEGFRVHKLLRAIDLNILITQLEEKDHAVANAIFYSPEELKNQYERYPLIPENTQSLLDQCCIELPSTFANNRQTFTGHRSDDLKLLHKLAYNGCKRRYGKENTKALARIQRELQVIEQQNFTPYFLITWDIIRYAQTAGYHHIGRGSGANSIVAFCLYITDVDPLELDLYFERFINPYRTSPPDFDIDFSWDERDDVTDYVFKRYGRAHTALLATYSTFKRKAIVRELGKVFGLPKGEIDKIVDHPTAKEEHHPYARHIFRYGEMMEGFPNYLSIHAGGVLITEEPINYFTALQMMPKGFPITHFDMYGAEDLGFHKYDLLSQRGLGHIKDAVALVKENQGNAIDIHEIDRFKNDEKVKAQLRSGNCMGCFYIESPAMRGLLKKLRCEEYVHLVAASSIIRPGVSKSGMMREYIHRFHHPHSFDYLHPVFKEHLGETFGVMVYQEDVMKITHHFAGLDMDEADVLRRIMSGKKSKPGDLERLQDKFFTNCKDRGHSEALSQEVWRQVESFSGYSFCKAHSASYAVESFQSLYLKAYYPLEFMVAVINNFGGFYQTEFYIHEARMQGGNIQAPCVNHSIFLTTIYGKDIYLGFVLLHQMEGKTARRIVAERKANGHFISLADFVNRVPIVPDQLELLIRIGAFRFTGMNQYELMWEKNTVYNPRIAHHETGRLFDDGYADFRLPDLSEGPFDQVLNQIELLGFVLSSPFDLLTGLPDKAKHTILAKALLQNVGKEVAILGYYVARKRIRTVNKKLMSFGTWLDREGQFFDTTHFAQSLSRFPFRGKGCYCITGRVVVDFGFPSVEVLKMEKLGWLLEES